MNDKWRVLVERLIEFMQWKGISNNEIIMNIIDMTDGDENPVTLTDLQEEWLFTREEINAYIDWKNKRIYRQDMRSHHV